MWPRLVTLVVSATILVASLPAPSDAQSSNVSSLLNWVPPKDWSAKFPYYISGFSNEGQPIVVWEFGKWNLNPQMSAGGKQAKMMENYFEQATQITIQLGTAFAENDGTIFISDLEGLNYLQMTHPPTVAMFLRIARYNPFLEKALYKGIAINVNYVAEQFFSIIAPIVGSSLAKSELLGTNKDRWQAQLSILIPRSQLPPWYGGLDTWKPLQVLGKGEPINIEMLRQKQREFLAQKS